MQRSLADMIVWFSDCPSKKYLQKFKGTSLGLIPVDLMATVWDLVATVWDLMVTVWERFINISCQQIMGVVIPCEKNCTLSFGFS